MSVIKKYRIAILLLVVLIVATIPAFVAASDAGFSDVEADVWYAEAAMAILPAVPRIIPPPFSTHSSAVRI